MESKIAMKLTNDEVAFLEALKDPKKAAEILTILFADESVRESLKKQYDKQR